MPAERHIRQLIWTRWRPNHDPRVFARCDGHAPCTLTRHLLFRHAACERHRRLSRCAADPFALHYIAPLRVGLSADCPIDRVRNAEPVLTCVQVQPPSPDRRRIIR